jgi:uncharacterized membrane protein
MPEEINKKTVKEQLDDQKEEGEKIVSESDKIDAMALLSYLGILCLIPLLTDKENDFVQYHAKQGFVLFIAEIVTMIIAPIPFLGWILAPILGLVWLALSVMGLINVLNAERKELPLIGQYSRKIKI